MKTPRYLFVALAGVCLSLPACEKETPPPAPAASAKPPPSAPPPTPTPQPVPQAASPDVDVASLEKQLGCSATPAVRQACRVLAEFAQGRRFTGETPSGDGKWFGYAYNVEKRTEKTDLMIFASRRVPLSQIGPNDLPIRVGTGTLPEDKRAHGQRFAAALARSDVVGKLNQAQPFVKSFVPAGDRGVVATAGASVRLISDEVVYVREGEGQKILVIRLSSNPKATPGDGTYAELWLAAW